MLLLNKFMKFNYGINDDHNEINTIDYDDTTIFIYRKNIGSFIIDYDNTSYVIEKNNIKIKQYVRHSQISLSIQTYLKENRIDIYCDLPCFPIVSISYRDEYSNREYGPSNFVIDFTKKDDARLSAPHKLAIDTYSYLREYFSVKKPINES